MRTVTQGTTRANTAAQNPFVARVQAALNRIGISRDMESSDEAFDNFLGTGSDKVAMAFGETVEGHALAESLLNIFVLKQLYAEVTGASEEESIEEGERMFRVALALGWALGQVDHEIQDEEGDPFSRQSLGGIRGVTDEQSYSDRDRYPSPASVGAEETGRESQLDNCEG